MSDRLSGTVTFLFTDIEGSTTLLKALGRERYGEVLARHQLLVREALRTHGGEEIDTQGDSFFAAFRSAGDAVSAAVTIARAFVDDAWRGSEDVRLRIGIHSGDAAGLADRYVGISVHRAARVGAVGHGGQVLVSDATRVLVEDDLPAGISLHDLGLYRLKDIDRPERIWQVDAEGVPAEFPPLRAERVKEPARRGRSLLALMAAGVLAVAVATAVFAFRGGGSGSSVSLTSVGADAVGAVDTTNGHIVGTASLGASPRAIAYGQGSAWVTMPNQDSVARIDTTTHTVRQTIAVGNGPDGIAVGGGFVWVANSLDGTLGQIDPATNGGQQVAKIPVGNGPTGVAYGLGAVWVANSVDRTVVRVDPRNGRPGRPIPVDAGADAIAVGDGAVWVTSESAGVLSEIDPKTGAVTDRIGVGVGPVAVAAGSGSVWVVNAEDATLSHVDPTKGRSPVAIPVGEGPSGVALAPGGRSVWVSNQLSGTLSQIDPALDKVAKTVPVGDLPQGIALGAGTAFVAVKGSGSAHRGGTLTLAVPNPPGVYNVGLPKSLDPAQGYTLWELLTLTNDGLVGYARSGGAGSSRIVPDLAVALPFVGDGGRTYSFQLRPGIHYSNGELVRLGDIRRGIERALATSGGATPASYLSGIVGASQCVKTPADCNLSKGVVLNPEFNTVTFHLSSPDPDFIYKLALPVADAVPMSTPLKARLPLPATGPYKIASLDVKRGVVTLVRNPRFRLWSNAAQPDGFPDRIVERFGYTGQSAVRAVESGKADVTADGPDQTWTPALASMLRTRFSSRLHHAPLPAAAALWLNMRLPPFNDIRVRQALNYAVDRNHLIDLAGGRDVAGLGCQLLPPNTGGYRPYCPYTVDPGPDGAYNGPDLAKSRRLVATSGTAGEPITVWFYDVPIGKVNGQYIVSVLRRLGYKATLRLLPHKGSTWLPNRQAGVGGGAEDYPSANNFLPLAFSCRSYDPTHPPLNLNFSGFCNRRIDGEMARARALQTSNPQAASQLWSKIDHEITDLAPWVILRTGVAPDFLSGRTGNYIYCYLTAATGSSGACLDQLWVR